MQVCGREGLGNLQLLQVAVLWVMLNGTGWCIGNLLVDAERMKRKKTVIISVLSDQRCTWLGDVYTFKWIQKL